VIFYILYFGLLLSTNPMKVLSPKPTMIILTSIVSVAISSHTSYYCVINTHACKNMGTEVYFESGTVISIIDNDRNTEYSHPHSLDRNII